MKAIWAFLTVIFGVATLGAAGDAIQSLKSSGAAGAHAGYSLGSGIIDGFLRVLFIGLLAFLTSACYRRAAHVSQDYTPRSDTRRPWQR
ncbi:hypothetical protein [Streptomyces sp. Tue6028]|uniref:hypothetical protein n=1 Tax=Streptomyces sp. Tue6028 TaxID=2036037 RepID=UPI003D702F77